MEQKGDMNAQNKSNKSFDFNFESKYLSSFMGKPKIVESQDDIDKTKKINCTVAKMTKEDKIKILEDKLKDESKNDNKRLIPVANKSTSITNINDTSNPTFTIGKYTGFKFSDAYEDTEFLRYCNNMCTQQDGKVLTPFEIQKFREYAVNRLRSEGKISFGMNIGLSPIYVFNRDMQKSNSFKKTYAYYCIKQYELHLKAGKQIGEDMKNLAEFYLVFIEDNNIDVNDTSNVEEVSY